MKNVVPFFCLFCRGADGIGMALFYLFVFNDDKMYMNHTLHTNTFHIENLALDQLFFAFLERIFLMLCGDVHSNPGPITKANTLSVVHNNICSLRNKIDLVFTELHNFDIITISETWFHESIPIDQTIIPGYSYPVRRDRSGWGGVAIYVKDHLVCIPRPDLEVTDLEAVWIETKINQDSLLVGCFYRPPNAKVQYWSLIEESISKASNSPHKFVVLGDFNDDCTERPSAHLSRLMTMNNLQQLVTEPTRRKINVNGIETATRIDLILTPCPNIVHKVGVLPPIDSDHCCTFIEIADNRLNSQTLSFKRKLYNYSKLDDVKYIDMLNQTDWMDIVTTLPLDEAADTFSEKLMEIVSKCVPIKIIKVRENDAPWMTEEIRTFAAKKLRIHTIAKILNSAWCWNLFRRIRNDLTTLIRKRKEDYMSELENRINDSNNFDNKD